jgi:demethylspheroidene O-methyltransferase
MLTKAASVTSRLSASLHERWCAVRSHLLMSRRFQDLSFKYPGSRYVARNSANDVFDLVAGFVYSQVLLACVQLKLFDHLKAGPISLVVLGEKLSLNPDALWRLMSAAESLRLVTRLQDDRYCLGFRGASIAGNEGVMRMIEHHALFYSDLADPVALLRGEKSNTALSRYWSYCSGAPQQLSNADVTAYTQLMSQSQGLVSSQILNGYSFAQHRRLLDIGGGDGTFLSTVAQRAPHLHLTLFDVPAVAQRAMERFKAEGLAHRAVAIGGDFFKDPIPGDLDLVTLVRVVHDHNDEEVMQLLRRIRLAMSPESTLLIAEPMAGDTAAATVGAAYFNFYLLAMGAGRARTAAEISTMLQAAGFDRISERKTGLPMQCKMLIARIDTKKRKASLT